MKRIIPFLIAILALCPDSFAENVKREENYASLSGISVTDNFNVQIVDGPSIKVSMTLEDVLADLVHLSLVDGILYIDYDEKSITKEIRAAIRRRVEKSLMMDVVISIPPSCAFNSIAITDNVVLTSKASFGSSNSFNVSVDGNAVIKALTLNTTEAVLTAKKRADVKASLTCGKTIVRSYGNSVLELNVSGNEASVESEGSSTVRFVSSVTSLMVNASANSKLSLLGTASKLELNGMNSANADASALDVKTAKIGLVSASCEVNVHDVITLTLSGGAKLSYLGSPVLDVNKVEKSSIFRKKPEE